MNDIALDTPASRAALGRRAVQASARLWFLIAALGHGIFLIYILAVFFPPVASHGLAGLDGLHLPSGFREGDALGNLAAVSHVLLAALVIGGGPLQLIPGVRQRFPIFHRWLGRAYLFAAMLSALGGLYMTWTRSPIGDLLSKAGISIDAILILVFGAMALRSALARRFDLHRRWAMRLFLAASAVWFFRVGLMAWVTLTGGIGIDFETFTGPFLYVLGFAQYLLPLAMLEWYFRAHRSSDQGMQLAFSITLLLLTGVMSIGIGTATMGMWLPRM
ncbi:DUF2306 domain-containing protein [Wenzhouxiangella marina]|uniref:Putative membrane protein n=1 Tax=Wenzhouxiangella marina TaxID=1579979 RepID=A0A0K0Y0H2_9GAMM|nr:DUF2306 domain-containing protein [Wenzhouxiangella marina]AKS43387.1 Putative membrane protein [Wenzhouxiangella marina]MBB6088497.1 hypothetical protein [Wenzhouxiangella marina]